VFPQTTTLAEHVAGAQAAYGARAGEFLRLYPAHDDVSAAAAAQDVLRDVTFGRQNWAWVNAQAMRGRAAAYYYQFTHPLPVEDGGYMESRTRPIGATHGAEIPYVFGTIGAFSRAGEADRDLARMLMRYWINFAANGDPNGSGLPLWPRFDAAAPRAMELKTRPELAPIRRFTEFGFWGAGRKTD
jgi:para-nitrobenzyl esterase